jgi:hypothetical protein
MGRPLPRAGDLQQSRKLNRAVAFAAAMSTLREAAVRDLAWLLLAPRLLSESAFGPLLAQAPLDLDLLDWLYALDADPAPLHIALAGLKTPRVGHYAERLVHFVLSHSPQFRLIAANLPLRVEKQTVGECDFLMEDLEGHRLHWELAVKCYLHVDMPRIDTSGAGTGDANGRVAGDAEAGDAGAGDAEAGDAGAGDAEAGDVGAGDAGAGDVGAGDVEAGDVEAGDVEAGDVVAGEADVGTVRIGTHALIDPLASFVGPALGDRLDIKLRRMLNHQLPLSGRADYAALLPPGPWRAQMWVSGWLFDRFDRWRAGRALNVDPRLAPDLLSGFWAPKHAWPDLAAALDADGWTRLPRLRWIAPLAEPDHSFCDRETMTALIETAFADPSDPPDISPDGMPPARPRGRDDPFAIAAWKKGADGRLHEIARGFIVADDWEARAVVFAAT